MADACGALKTWCMCQARAAVRSLVCSCSIENIRKDDLELDLLWCGGEPLALCLSVSLSHTSGTARGTSLYIVAAEA